MSTRELMSCSLAARLHDGEIVIIGGASPIPMAAALLAQQTTAPNLTLLTGSGAVNPRPAKLAPSGGDYEYVRTAEAYFTMDDVFDDTERGRWDVGIFGGLQIDRHGHFNLAFVGGFRGPGLVNAGLPRTVRRSLLCVERHTPRVFVQEVDFVSGSGNDACVTDLACLDFSGEATLVSTHADEEELVRERTGFTLAGAPHVTPEPPADVVEVLRRGVDPTGVLA
jgi:glutaconate CoA-transferase, subunit B